MLAGFMVKSLPIHAGTPSNDKAFDDNIPDSFPIPDGVPNMLFFVQRTPNLNTIVYELNLKNDGKLNEDEPVHPFWIQYAGGGEHRELNYIQRKFAYGLKVEPMDGDRYKLTFVSYKKRNFYLVYAPRDNRYHVYGSINNKVALINRMYIQIDPGGSFWSPNVKYIQLAGREVSTGKEMTERIMISK